MRFILRLILVSKVFLAAAIYNTDTDLLTYLYTCLSCSYRFDTWPDGYFGISP